VHQCFIQNERDGLHGIDDSVIHSELMRGARLREHIVERKSTKKIGTWPVVG